MKPFGRELIMDIYDVSPDTVNDLRICYDFLAESVEALGVHQQAPPYIFQSPEVGPNGEDWADKKGLSGWVPLIESAVSIHTLVPKNFIVLNFFTCGTLDQQMQIRLNELVARTFKPKKVDQHILERGKYYYKND